jgi:hypothetical protein
MSEQPQNVEGEVPDPESTDWHPDLPEGEQDDAYYGEEGSDEDA